VGYFGEGGGEVIVDWLKTRVTKTCCSRYDERQLNTSPSNGTGRLNNFRKKERKLAVNPGGNSTSISFSLPFCSISIPTTRNPLQNALIAFYVTSST